MCSDAWLPPLRRRCAARSQRIPLPVGRCWSGWSQVPTGGVRREAAANPGLPAGAVEAFAQRSDVFLRMGAARNPVLPLRCFAGLAEREPRSVAENANCPAEMLDRLADSRARGVTWQVAANASTRPQALERIMAAGSLREASCAAQHPNLPAGALTAAASDVRIDLRFNAAYNPNCPPETLDRIARSRPGMLRSAVSNPSVPVSVIEDAARHHKPTTRAAAPANPSAPEWVIKEAAHDTDDTVRDAAASNPSLPLPLLAAACDDPSGRARNAAAAALAARVSSRSL